MSDLEMTRGQHVGVITGNGVVIRLGTTVVVIGALDHVDAHLIEQVTTTIATATGDEMTRELARLVLADDDPPALGVARLETPTASVFLHGNIELAWPSGRSNGTDHVLGVSEAMALSDGFNIVLGGTSHADVASWNHLVAGTVPGAGVVVGAAPRASDAAAAWEPPDIEDAQAVAESVPTGAAVDIGPEPDVDEEAPFEVISLANGDLSDRSPLPVATADPIDDEVSPAYERPVPVIGVYSPRGFFNHPDAKYCSRTGVKMGASMTKVFTEGPRPPLGVLTLDDGSTVTVRWNTVIGRDPTVDEMVRTGHAAPFVVSDIAQSVSRRHALLELVDWDVLISDLGSRNGTYVQSGPDEPLRKLAANERVVLDGGTIVHLGKRSFVYNEHHVR